MSILKSIKDTFKSVQGDVSGSFKTLGDSPERPKVPVVHHQKTVSFDAGADILHRNEIAWKDLYQYSEENAKRAENVDVQIGNLYIYWDKQSEILVRVHDEASRLPTLITQLQDITDSLALVEEEYDKVEAALVHLENLCEELEFKRNVTSHHKQLAVYKMKKEHELQNYKVKLARQHAQKVEQVNRKKQLLMHEKQAAFDDQFTQDIEYFKKHGKPGRLPSTPESEKKLDLAEVKIDEDQEALDAFLESEDTTMLDTKVGSDQEALSDSEGPTVEVIPKITSPSEICNKDTTESRDTTGAEPKDEIVSPDEKETPSPTEGVADSEKHSNETKEREIETSTDKKF